jgi:hypothetical protein
MKYKLLGIVFVLLTIAAIVSSIYNWQVSHIYIPGAPIHQDSTANWKSYNMNGFEIKTPQNYDFSTSASNSFENYLGSKGKALVRISMPKDSYPKTNFSEGYITVASANISESACKKYSDGQLKSMDQLEMINGINFNKTEFQGAAAGNYYQTRLYHAFRNASCFEISVTLHTTNIGNYEPGTVTEVNSNDAWNKLSAVLKTFRFTN